jgi:pimeloyl-ACP methyl ester carboxylesterase
MASKSDKFERSICPMQFNGMQGRYLSLPRPVKKNRDILLIYGHHASLERMKGLALALNRYGSVTTPDLPGFGGMDSFYKIGRKPDIDQLAEYLASYIKLRYKKERFTVIGISFGFIIITRMLQLYPRLADQIDFVVAGVGFLSHHDIKYPKSKQFVWKCITAINSTRLFSFITKNIVLNRHVIKLLFDISDRKKLGNETIEQRRTRIDFEINLWRENDVRTHFYTLNKMLHVELTDKPVSTLLWHLSVDNDQYLDAHSAREHIRAVYSNYKHASVDSDKHAPTVVASAQEAMNFIPPSVRRALNK